MEIRDRDAGDHSLLCCRQSGLGVADKDRWCQVWGWYQKVMLAKQFDVLVHSPFGLVEAILHGITDADGKPTSRTTYKYSIDNGASTEEMTVSSYLDRPTAFRFITVIQNNGEHSPTIRPVCTMEKAPPP